MVFTVLRVVLFRISETQFYNRYESRRKDSIHGQLLKIIWEDGILLGHDFQWSKFGSNIVVQRF